MPDPQKGHKPCAFIIPTVISKSIPVVPEKALTDELQKLVRQRISPIASLGCIIQGDNIIPKTRSGKTLRRTLRDLVENAAKGELDKPVYIPPTIEDRVAVENARKRLKDYVFSGSFVHQTCTLKPRL
jgi:propionyl-CoA synthetase